MQRPRGNAEHEVFPGCPLTFRLAEMMCPLALERVFIGAEERVHAPDLAVAEKLWRAQFPDTARWRLNGSFKETAHFSLVALVRSEIQAIDQHWSLHRIALALPDGEPDEALARNMSFATAFSEGPGSS